MSLIDCMIRKYDRNGDGELDASELAAFCAECFPETKVIDGMLSALMSALDLNQDGTVSTTELRAFLRCYDPMAHIIKTKTALLIIDMQNDFISGSLANPFNAEEIVPTINGLRDSFDLVVIVHDWHPHEHCSFVESASAGVVPIVDGPETLEPYSMVVLAADSDRDEHTQMLYPRHAVQGTEGADCHSSLVIKPLDPRIYKGTKENLDSYSAFFDNCRAHDTGLTATLEGQGITDVYVCGLVFDISVKTSALHAAELGFKVVVIEDACKPQLADQVEPTKTYFADAGVSVMSSKDALECQFESKVRTLTEYLGDIRESKGAKRTHTKVAKYMSSHTWCDYVS